MTVLTLHCLFCSGTGREPLGAITVKCHVCKGVGSVPAPGVASEPPAPSFTLDDAMRQIRQLQHAVIAMSATDPPSSLAVRRLSVRAIEAELLKAGGAE